MNTRQLVRSTLIFLCGAFAISAASVGTLSLSIQDVASEYPNREAVHCVDGSGLDANNPPNHDTMPINMWLNLGDGVFNGGVGDPDRPGQLGHITFNLGGTFFVNAFRVWNYNESTSFNFTNRGVIATKTFTVTVTKKKK